MTVPIAVAGQTSEVLLNRKMVQRIASSDRDVALSGSLYAVPAAHRVAAAEVLARHGLWVHADVFADARTGVSMDLIQRLADEAAAPIDVHLLTADAMGALPAVCRMGIARVTFPFEGVEDAAEVAARVREAGAAPWLAIAPWTSVDEAAEALVHVDGLLVMLLRPGTRDRADAKLLAKADAASRHQPVGVDGGVGEANVNAVLASGARYVVVGRRLFEIHRHMNARTTR